MDYSRSPGELSNKTRHLVHNHRRSPGNLCIQPGYIVGIHVDTTMAAVSVKRGGAGWIPMGEIHTGAIDAAPPAIVKEVAARVIFHRILDRRRRIPERRAGRFG